MTLSRLAEPALVADRVYDALEDAIMRGEFGGGARLRVNHLAEQLGTSPMPVRDALARLEQVGLTHRVPHKGAVVSTLTPAELVEVYDARLLLEREATRLGSQHLRAADADQMRTERRATLAAAEAGKRADALDHDEAMLAVLYAASGNSVILGLIQTLWRRCRPYKLFGVGSLVASDDASLWAAQEPLIDAAMAHDSATAVTVVEESLTTAIERIRAVLGNPH